MTKVKNARTIARKWYDDLQTMTQDEAIATIPAGFNISVMHGTIRSSMPRGEVLDLIATGTRIAPADQSLLYQHHRLVVMGEDGFPVQIKTVIDAR